VISAACIQRSALLPGELDEAAQPIGTAQQTCDIDCCLLDRIVA
jgi:hypothetical protein